MSYLKKLCTVISTFLIICSNFTIVKAEAKYKIADASSGELVTIEEFDSFSNANSFYKSNKDDYDNLVFIEDDEIIKMEYGIVEFISDSCSLNSDYKSLTYGEGYTNSCYATDAAYLNTSNDYQKVTFKLAGDTGTISIDKVKLVPYELVGVRLSAYENSNGSLHHNIKTSLDNDYYIYSISIDDGLDYLNNEQLYYSYDGHYFYEDFKQMIDDYRANDYDNAINEDNPYYNYYVYLPHRSYTNYSLKEVEDYFSNVLCFDGKIQFYDDLNRDNANDDVNLSQYYGELASFFSYEKIYGANAMMMLALSAHESAYGKSLLAFSKNNLFGHAAYDSEAERLAARYNSIDTSIYSHAKYYISRLYAGVHSGVYHGSFFGDKLSGMNVKYSSDPYWGEKAASFYYRFDSALGKKDKDTYALGIIDSGSFKVYKDSKLSNVSYSVDNAYNFSVIILEELDNAYKIQVDASYNDEYLYDPVLSCGYVDKDIVNYILNEDSIHKSLYKTINFDFDGGQLAGKENLSIKVLENSVLDISAPKKDGYEFIGFNPVLNNEDNEYAATYKKIDKVEIYSEFNKTIEYDYFYNLENGQLKVFYDDGSYRVVNIDTNMIESYDTDLEGENIVTINYCGAKIEYPVIFSKELKEYRLNLNEYIENNISSYKEDGSYNLDELKYIKANLKKVDYLTTFDDIRYLDKMLLENNRDKVNYHFKDSKYDVSISGLALSLNDPVPVSVFKPFKDTYYIETSNISLKAKERLTKIAKAYGFNVEDSLKIKVSYNLASTKFENPILIQIKIPDKKNNRIYSVYHLDDKGNVIKCMTNQTENYISFMTRSEGDFMILSLDSVNTYNIEDRYENISIYNADPDNHLLFIEGAVLAVIALFGFIMIIIHNIVEKKKEKVWNDYKKSLQGAVSLQEEKLKN